MRFLAFYLPQFHPIPENDVWWGRGFTEWSNVVQAAPLFEGHHQPQLPGELGFYDLRLPEVRVAQAELARAHGIDGFVYYHYWFNGRRLLERPFEEVRASGEPDLPFALCWANEPWTRTWSGRGASFLLQQSYSEQDDDAHIAYLLEAFEDPRYLRVGDQPLLLVYNAKALPDPRRTFDRFRAAADAAGVARPWIVKCDTFLDDTDPASLGADASCDFPPHGASRLATATPYDTPVAHERIDYDELAGAMVRRPPVGWTRYPTVVPGWDNTARRGDGGATVLADVTPERFERWMVAAAQRVEREVDEPIVFVNAWNEWAEGAHLEPDARWGRAFLDATLRARRTVQPGFEPAAPSPTALDGAGAPTDVGRLYVELRERHLALEAESTGKFEAGQEALRNALEDRERELKATREQLRRQAAWAEQLQADALDVAAVAGERDALRAELAQLGRSPVGLLRLWLRNQRWAQAILGAARGARGR